MSKFARQTGWLLLAIAVVAVARAYFGAYDLLIKDRLLSTLRDNGVVASVAATSAKFPLAIEFEELGLVARVGRVPVPIQVSQGEIALILSKLLLGQLEAGAVLHLYGGKLSGECSRPLWSSSSDCRVSAENLSLSSYPLLSPYGISGALNASASLSVNGRLLKGADLEAGIRSLSLPPGVKINGLFPLPQFENGEVDLLLHSKDQSTEVKLLRFRSTLGRIDAQGEFSIANGKIIEGKGSGTIQLAESGQKTLAAYLALAAGLPPQAEPIERWKILVSANNGVPSFKVAPLQ